MLVYGCHDRGAGQLVEPVAERASIRKLGSCEIARGGIPCVILSPGIDELKHRQHESPKLVDGNFRSRACTGLGQDALARESPIEQRRLESIDPVQKVNSLYLGRRNATRCKRNRRFCLGPDECERSIHTAILNTSRLVEPAVLLIRQVPFGAEEMLRLPNSLVEGKVFETVDRVVMHERFHRPELRDRFNGLFDLVMERAHRGHRQADALRAARG